MKNLILAKVVLVASFTLCIYVNYISNAWPLNGFTAGELSDLYPNQFTPAGFTFAVWGVIYLTTIIATGALVLNKSGKISSNIYYHLTLINILNLFWLICWHYQKVLLSVLVMTALLVALILLYENVRKTDDGLFVQKALKVMTSFYLSWISVALIANITALIVKLELIPGNIFFESVIAAVLLLIALLICWRVTKRYHDFLHPLILAWASFGVYSKMNQPVFNNNDAVVFTATVVVILSLFISVHHARKSLIQML
jgi:hypothetical protein